MMFHNRFALRGEEVAARALEEVEHCRVLKGRRVRQSTTASAPARTPAKPSPVSAFTPLLGEPQWPHALVATVRPSDACR